MNGYRQSITWIFDAAQVLQVFGTVQLHGDKIPRVRTINMLDFIGRAKVGVMCRARRSVKSQPKNLTWSQFDIQPCVYGVFSKSKLIFVVCVLLGLAEFYHAGQEVRSIFVLTICASCELTTLSWKITKSDSTALLFSSPEESHNSNVCLRRER